MAASSASAAVALIRALVLSQMPSHTAFWFIVWLPMSAIGPV